MAKFDYPDNLEPSVWDKQKATIAKAPKAPKTGLGDVLKELAKRHASVAWGFFNADKLTTVKDLEERLDFIVAETKAKFAKLIAQADAAQEAAEDFIKAAGKDFAKEPLAAATKIKEAARQYATQVDAVASDALNEVKAALAKAKAGDKKAPPGAASKVESKGAKLIRARGLETIRKVRKPTPGAKPSRFMVVEWKKVVRVFMGPVAGPAQDKLLRSLIPNEKPVKVHKDNASEVLWEKNALTLVSDRIPMGLVKKVMAALKIQLKMSIKVRMRKTSGEAEEAADADAKEISDDMVKADPAEAREAAAAGKEFLSRLAKLKPNIDKAMKSFDPDDKKALADLVASIKKNGDAKKFDDAASDLDDIEAMLDETPSGDSDDDALDPAQIAKLHGDWLSVKGDAVRDIKKVAEAVVALYRKEGQALPAGMRDAIVMLNGRIDKLENGLDKEFAKLVAEKDGAKRKQQAEAVKAAAIDLRRYVKTDKIMVELDGNDIHKVAVSGPVMRALDGLEAALS